MFSSKQIPGWGYVKPEVLRMADRLACIPYMGWDAVITNDVFGVLSSNYPEEELGKPLKMVMPVY